MRAVVRAAIDAGLLQPAGYRGTGGNSYARLFDLAEAGSKRDNLAAALDGGQVVPRGPRTRRYEAAAAVEHTRRVERQKGVP